MPAILETPQAPVSPVPGHRRIADALVQYPVGGEADGGDYVVKKLDENKAAIDNSPINSIRDAMVISCHHGIVSCCH